MNYVMKKGDEGQEVKRLQTYLLISADGKFGPKPEQAVRDHQQLLGLTVDGKAGPQTLASLKIPVLPGIDLSRHNGRVDFKKVAASGVKYAWVKVTEGTTHINPGFEDKFKGCRDHGIIVGGYHFGRPDTYADNPADANNEAEHFLDTISRVGIRRGDLVPVLDVEAGMKTDDQFNADWTLEWLTRVRVENTIRCMVYTASWATDLYLKHASVASRRQLASYPLWWARYHEGIEPNNSHKMLSWDEWKVWQWTGHGQVPGVTGRCDQNWMAGGALNSLIVS